VGEVRSIEGPGGTNERLSPAAAAAAAGHACVPSYLSPSVSCPGYIITVGVVDGFGGIDEDFMETALWNYFFSRFFERQSECL